jgi:SAM-dependent methyltransferase
LIGRSKRWLSIALNKLRIDPMYLYYVLGIKPLTLPKEIKYRLRGAPDGLPLPPRKLVFKVAGSPWADHFLELGEICFREIGLHLADCSVDISSLRSILDFGCGCGRVTRHFASLDVSTLAGCDYNPALVSWCKEHLPFAQFDINSLEPPLKYDDGKFDLIFAGSVFTHLDAGLQVAWMTELRRALAPGGYIYFTTAGDSYTYKLSRMQLSLYESGECVTVFDEAVGKNVCLAVEPRAFIENHLSKGLEIKSYIAEGAHGFGHQDVYIMKKLDSTTTAHN